MGDWIKAPSRSKDAWDMDSKSYTLIRVNEDNDSVEVRVVKVQPEHFDGKFTDKQEVLGDYFGFSPEDIYYKIINDGWITNYQHAAYLGKELQKAFLALKFKKNYIQDKELDL
jgi:hypothetical protein